MEIRHKEFKSCLSHLINIMAAGDLPMLEAGVVSHSFARNILCLAGVREMVDIFQTTFVNTFSPIKIFEFWSF